MKKVIDSLYKTGQIEKEDIIKIYKEIDKDNLQYLFYLSDKKRQEFYKKEIYIRGLIEFSNYCTKKCKYCGINSTNKNADRFRLTKEEIFSSIDNGYNLGFRTIVLQGGEDNYFTDEKILKIINYAKSKYEDLAITLSLGEKDYLSYKKFFTEGADRYLLRHETINENLFNDIHINPTYKRRIDSLFELKEIGYQVGAGFMVGIPNQTYEDLADDILFLKKLDPEMVGLGPFIPHKDTIYKDKAHGSLRDTLISLSLVRLSLGSVLLPATTALSTINKDGRDLGIKSACNVIMPNLSPKDKKDKYSLYNNKLNTGIESALEIEKIKKDIKNLGYEVVVSRGDNIRRR